MTGCAAVVFYTFLGGFLAVSWTDAFQAMLMLTALIVTALLAMDILLSNGDTIDVMNKEIQSAWQGDDTLSATAAISLAAWGLGYFGQPHILARFMAISSPDRTLRAGAIATSWAGAGMAAAIGVGLAGALLFPGLQDSEKIFMVMVKELMHPVPAGICLAGILAAIMSTADSQLLVSASALTEDFYRRLLRRNASDKELVWISRLTVLVVAGVATLLALKPNSSVLQMVGYAWAGFGASFGPVLLLSLYWNRLTGAGALAGIIGGGLAVIVWQNLSGNIFDLYEIVPGVVIAFTAAILFSYLSMQRVDACHR